MVGINLKGRVTLLTGSTGKLGKPIAKTLARCGSDLVLHYRSEDETAMALAEECRRFGVEVTTLQGDLLQPALPAEMRETLLEKGIKPSILILNAIGSQEWGELESVSSERASQAWDVAVTANLRIIQAFAPGLPSDGTGRIIGLSSENAAIAGAGMGMYSAAKLALGGILQSAAHELGPRRITVNQVAPGWTAEEGEETPDWYQQRLLLPHRTSPQDVANAVAFLASDLASSITNVWLPITSGSVGTRP